MRCSDVRWPASNAALSGARRVVGNEYRSDLDRAILLGTHFRKPTVVDRQRSTPALTLARQGRRTLGVFAYES